MTEWWQFWLVLFGGIALFGWIIVLLDWLARRKERDSTSSRSARP